VLLAAAAAGLLAATLAARNVDLATLPPRDSVQLTIYNSEDLTLVRETRSLTLKTGLNRIQYSWAGTLIDPTSVEIRPLEKADQIEILDTLEQAVGDCVYVAALTARERSAKRTVLRPIEAAEELIRRAAEGPVAIVAGREDRGLTNEELDRCHALVTIPVNPAYRSLNLAQAVAIMCYETWRARTGDSTPLKPPRREAGTATSDQLERMFKEWEAALWAIDFFKTRQPEYVMRSVREIFFRAALDGRESTLIRAIALEMVRYLERMGVRVASEPLSGTPQTPAGES